VFSHRDGHQHTDFHVEVPFTRTFDKQCQTKVLSWVGFGKENLVPTWEAANQQLLRQMEETLQQQYTVHDQIREQPYDRDKLFHVEHSCKSAMMKGPERDAVNDDSLIKAKRKHQRLKRIAVKLTASF
jgi:hypothetical protein